MTSAKNSNGMGDLSQMDKEILDFELRAPQAIALKEKAIRAELDISPVRYHQRLNVILELPEALAYNPVLVKRLLRKRGQRDDIRRAAHENPTDEH
ncbi:DUF3263 domain-containing protein [Corynebacterium sp. L4756]|uniref:DUF3263 domain-containing protein n=1 Tax=unclassified Corynebacterium TaxID=2624378 RepID=UPI00374D5F26